MDDPHPGVETGRSVNDDGVVIIHRRVVKGDTAPCRRCRVIRTVLVILSGGLVIGLLAYGIDRLS